MGKINCSRHASWILWGAAEILQPAGPACMQHKDFKKGGGSRFQAWALRERGYSSVAEHGIGMWKVQVQSPASPGKMIAGDLTGETFRPPLWRVAATPSGQCCPQNNDLAWESSFIGINCNVYTMFPCFWSSLPNGRTRNSFGSCHSAVSSRTPPCAFGCTPLHRHCCSHHSAYTQRIFAAHAVATNSDNL